MVSSRNYTIATIVLATLGVGVWWLLPLGGSQNTKGIQSPSVSWSSTGKASSAPTLTQSRVVTASASSESSATKRSRELAASQEAVSTSTEALEFTEQADSDPALSREIESATRRAVDITLDRSKYEVHHVTCRGNSCQILSFSRSPGSGNQWPAAVALVMDDLEDASIRNPSTGAELKPVEKKTFRLNRSEDAPNLTIIEFQ